ncbi:MAG TPA: OmpA family protein [Polyangiaceae bacterium]|nr:OmpA family protein [Polyangiaceae bacterium]
MRGPSLRGFCPVLLALLVGFSAAAASAPRAAVADGGQVKRLPPLELRLDPSDVDIEGGQIRCELSRPAAKLVLKVLGVDGAVLAQAEQAFEAAPAGTPLVIRWQPPAERVARIELFGHDTSGYFKGIAITPWSFEVPHEDVVFRTDSADIDPAEERKLAASLALIEKELPRARQLGQVTLFILAHTDRVGSVEYNAKLSTRRALAIGRWFARHGVGIAMAYDGVGESMPKVETPDEVAEPRNRRVDYMLAIEPPRFKRSRVTPAWKRL